jgi:hypothetical protein
MHVTIDSCVSPALQVIAEASLSTAQGRAVAVEAVTSAATTHNTSELSMLRMAARAAVMYALQAQDPAADSLQEHTTQQLRASVAQPRQAPGTLREVKHARQLHGWGPQLHTASVDGSNKTSRSTAGLLHLLAHELSLLLSQFAEGGDKVVPGAGGSPGAGRSEEVIDAQVQALLASDCTRRVTPEHIRVMADMPQWRREQQHGRECKRLRGTDSGAAGRRRLRAQHERELPGGIHPGSTIYGHSTQLGESVRAALRAGQYQPHVDQPTLVCAQLLPWWQVKGA